MWKKIASLAAMLSASLTVSGCETAAYKPVVYKPIPTGRTAKVPPIAKRTVDTPAPKAKAKKTKPTTSTFVPAWAQPVAAPADRIVPPRVQQNVYGLPQ